MSTSALVETDRLRLRPWTLEAPDLAWAHRIYGDPEVVRTIGGQVMADLDATRAHVEMRLERRRNWGERYGAWAAELRDSGEVIGTGLLKPLPDASGVYGEDVEVGWHLARARWGSGFATELGRGLVRHARADLGLPWLNVVVEAGNRRSLAVARRLGFIPQGRTARYYSGLQLEHLVCNLSTPKAEVFITERLRVRRWRNDEQDAQAALRMYGDPEVARFVGGVVTDAPADYAKRMAQRDDKYAAWEGRYGVWAAEDRASGAVVGTALLKPAPDAEGQLSDDFEMGWHLEKAVWGRGLATEMARGLVDYAVRLGELRRVHALVDAPNVRSVEVARRLGMTDRGTTRAYYEGDELRHYALELEPLR